MVLFTPSPRRPKKIDFLHKSFKKENREAIEAEKNFLSTREQEEQEEKKKEKKTMKEK